jgi:hypothetical protein
MQISPSLHTHTHNFVAKATSIYVNKLKINSMGKQLNYVGRNNLSMFWKQLKTRKMNLIDNWKFKVNSMAKQLNYVARNNLSIFWKQLKFRKIILNNYCKSGSS